MKAIDADKLRAELLSNPNANAIELLDAQPPLISEEDLGERCESIRVS